MTKLLIIEDDTLIRENLKKLLELNSFECKTAPSGEEGIELMIQYKPDLVICDVMMDGMDGFEVIAHMRQQLGNYFTPFIFLTARADSIDRQKGMNLGADDYLVKPFAIKDLIETINNRLAISKERVEQKTKLASEKAVDIFFNLSMHNYLNPLNGILNTADILLSESTVSKLDSDEVQMLKFMKHSGETMLRLSRKLFWYFQLKEKNSNPWLLIENETSNLKEVIDDCYKLKNTIQKSLNWQLNISKECNNVYGYNTEILKHMIEELFENALRFSTENSAITIDVSRNEMNILIYAENIFSGEYTYNKDTIEAFYRAHKNLDYSGVGLGLFILKSWLEKVGGLIEINCVQNKFGIAISFPIQRIQL